jgi:hypothetical protein
MHQNVRLVGRPAAVLCALAVGFTSLTMASHGQTQMASRVTTDARSWPLLGHDAQHTNFNPVERIIGRATASHLHPAWSVRYVNQAVATVTRL